MRGPRPFFVERNHMRAGQIKADRLGSLARHEPRSAAFLFCQQRRMQDEVRHRDRPEAVLRPITQIAAQLGLEEDNVIPYGRYKAKIDHHLAEKPGKQGKLILVTAISPTPAGEGKTTTSVGLADALCALGKKTMLCLREPSLGPCLASRAAPPGAAMPRWCYGGHQPPLHRGHPRHRHRQQPAGRHDRQQHPAGQPPCTSIPGASPGSAAWT